MMITETEHFILTNMIGIDAGGHESPLPVETGLKIQIKNVDGSVESFCFILYKRGKCYIETVGSKLQDYITSWELFAELVRLLDEGFDRVEYAVKMAEFSKMLD